MTHQVNHQERIKFITFECTTKRLQFSLQVQQQVNGEVNFEDVNGDLKLSFLKLICGNCQGNKSCLTQKREIKVEIKVIQSKIKLIQIIKFSKNREI